MRGLIRLARGDRFAGDLEVVRQLAEGGMGTVYAVRDHAAGEDRALKLLLPELVADPSSRRRFTQEAEIASTIESPYVPQVYRGGIDPVTSTPFILMELLAGEDLRARVVRVGALDAATALPIFDQLTHALGAAHRAGVVHRDLKPPNVFLQQDDDGTTVKLLDFGVAKLLDAQRTSGTGTGAVGSPLWMAPEQTSSGGRIAPATDVWALGLLAFYVLSGKVFWESATSHQGVTGLLREIHLDPIPLASERARQLGVVAALPEGFDAWFERAVCREQRLRYRDATIAMEALRPVLRPTHADTSSTSSPGPTPFDFAKTTRFDATRSNPAVPQTPTPAPQPQTSGEALDAAEVPDTREQFLVQAAPRPASHASAPDPALSQPSQPAPSQPPAAATPERARLSPLAWVALLLLLGFGAAFAAAAAVWVVLTLTTP